MKRFLKLPSPKQVKERLEKAIDNAESPAQLLYEFLQEDNIISNVVKDNLKTYRDAVLVLTSQKGRLYLYVTLSNVLDYLEKLVKEL